MNNKQTTIIIIVLIAVALFFAFNQKGCSINDIFTGSNNTYSGGDSNGDQTPDQSPDNNESPRCIDHDGNNIWLASYVDDTVVMASYPDTCKDEPFKRYLYEKVCVNGLPSQIEVDCWAQEGTICDSGACVKQNCASIINPNSQADCDKGHASCSESPYTYCKYYAPTTQNPSKCVCTIDPTTVDTCDESCLFYQQVDGYCANPLQKVPCGSNTHYIDYDKFCPLQNSFRMACCCRK